MENCSGYYESLHLDISYLGSLFCPLKYLFYYLLERNDNERKEINIDTQTLVEIHFFFD